MAEKKQRKAPRRAPKDVTAQAAEPKLYTAKVRLYMYILPQIIDRRFFCFNRFNTFWLRQRILKEPKLVG